MNNPVIRFGGNCNTSVVKQGKYRVVHHKDGFAVEVIIETSDGIRAYPTSRTHPDLVAMVNRIKLAVNGTEGGPFYINEWQQVVVPAGNPVGYFLAGEYPHSVLLTLDGVEFSGRPHDDAGNLLKPGDVWEGRPRPGIEYVLKAGGADVEFSFELSPGREKSVRLSREVGEAQARQTSRKISQVKGSKGGRFYINEYRALFGPLNQEDGYHYVFIGILTDEDPWFGKWLPNGSSPPVTPPPTPGSTAPKTTMQAPAKPDIQPPEKKVEIADGEMGHSMDSLFSTYLHGATAVTIDDPFVAKPHQVANLLRFAELLVRLGTIRKLRLITKEVSDDSRGRLETIKRSLAAHNIEFTFEVSATLHDRRIVTNVGWEISLGRGLDFYKRPEDWLSVGASDFALRPCYQTTLIFHRLAASQPVLQSL